MKSMVPYILLSAFLFNAHSGNLCAESDYLVVRDAGTFHDGLDNRATILLKDRNFEALCKSLRKSISTEFLCGFHWRFDFATDGATRYSQLINVKCEDKKILKSIQRHFPDQSANGFIYTVHFAKDVDKSTFAAALVKDSIYPLDIEKNPYENINALVMRYSTASTGSAWSHRMEAHRSHKGISQEFLKAMTGSFPDAIVEINDESGSSGSKDSSRVNWNLVLRSPSLDSSRILKALGKLPRSLALEQWMTFQPTEQTIHVAARMRTPEEMDAVIRTKYPFIHKIESFNREYTIESIYDLLPADNDSESLEALKRLREAYQ